MGVNPRPQCMLGLSFTSWLLFTVHVAVDEVSGFMWHLSFQYFFPGYSAR